MADTGNGATFTLSGFTVDIVAISIGEMRVDMLDKSLLSTTGFIEKLVADLVDAGSVTIEYFHDASDSAVTPGGAAASGTVTWPLQSGESTPANLAGTGNITSHKYPDFRNNELQNGSMEFTWDGITGPTLTASS